MADDERLTVTGAALLGLLALRPWTTYELAKQAQRSLQWFWPRAERKLYDEPKKLVAAGFATASAQATGRRKSTMYEITPAGRQALRRWLDEAPSSEPTLEIEQLVRVFFGDQGSADQLRTSIARTGAQARRSLAELGAIVAAAAPDDATLRERDAVNAIGLRLVVDLHRTIADWAEWAGAVTADWDATTGVDWQGYDEVFADASSFAVSEE
jgi:PadR family transcriptional regulator, regulatory protein AphA